MNEWRRLGKRSFRFVTKLREYPLLSLYFFFSVCILGALGAWIPAGQIWFGSESVSSLSVFRNLATYIISVSFVAIGDCIVRNRNDDDGATFRFFHFIWALFAVVLSIFVFFTDDIDAVKWLSKISGLFAATAWLMANDSHPDLTPSSAYTTLGGEFPN